MLFWVFSITMMQPVGAEGITYQAMIKLTSDQWQILNRFSQDEAAGSLQDAHEVLDKMYTSVERIYDTDYNVNIWEFTVLGQSLNTVLLVKHTQFKDENFLGKEKFLIFAQKFLS